MQRRQEILKEHKKDPFEEAELSLLFLQLFSLDTLLSSKCLKGDPAYCNNHYQH